MAASLTIDGPHGKIVYEVVKETTVVGRVAECDLKVEDPLASREHFKIVRLGGGEYKIFDLDSKNGTVVNGKNVKEAVLDPGDVISVGAVSIIFGFDAVRVQPFAHPQSFAPQPHPTAPPTQSAPARPGRPGSGELFKSGMRSLLYIVGGVSLLAVIMTIAVLDGWFPPTSTLTVPKVWLLAFSFAGVGILLQVIISLIALNLKKPKNKK